MLASKVDFYHFILTVIDLVTDLDIYNIRIIFPLDTRHRELRSTEVWFDTQTGGKITLSSYVTPTKSAGVKNVLMMGLYPTKLADGGYTKDHVKKTPLYKLYDLSMGGKISIYQIYFDKIIESILL